MSEEKTPPPARPAANPQPKNEPVGAKSARADQEMKRSAHVDALLIRVIETQIAELRVALDAWRRR